MLNRSLTPEAKAIDNINFIPPTTWTLKNGIPVYEYNLASEDIVKIDFVFPAGTKYQKKPLIASTVNHVMKEGTAKYSSKQIADGIDFYGAFLENEMDNDTATISVYSLNKYIDNVLPMVVDVLLNATFPQEEIDNYLKLGKQSYLLGQEKVETLASQAYIKNIFADSAYGQVASLNDYDSVTREDLIAFYKTYYSLSNVEIFIAGKSHPILHEFLNNLIGNIPLEEKNTHAFNFKQPNFTAKNIFIKKEGAIQTAIRYGMPTIKIGHEDFLKFQVLNTLFGGYFGSRLMMNIREDKGYTYGIGSGISSKQEIGNFIISTEVGADVTNLALKEINFEINRIKMELVDEEELHVVKNYMLGSLLKNTDGPFDLLDRYKTIHFNQLELNYYDTFIQKLSEIKPKDIQETANKYLNNFTVILAGSVDFE